MFTKSTNFFAADFITSKEEICNKTEMRRDYFGYTFNVDATGDFGFTSLKQIHPVSRHHPRSGEPGADNQGGRKIKQAKSNGACKSLLDNFPAH